MQDFWKNKRVLITGHTGFKGSWLAFWLEGLGAKVSGLSLEPDSSPNLFENLRLENRMYSVIGDIRDLKTVEQVFDGFKPEIVFHLAAQSLVRRSYREPIETYTTNVIGTVNILDAIRRAPSVKSVVVVTTDKCYENREQLSGYREQDRLGGFDPYSNSKACAELAVSAYRNSFFSVSNTLIASARAGNVIGGGDWSEDRLLPDVFRSLISDRPLSIRNPNSVRPWQHVLESLAGYLILARKLYEGDTAFAEAWNFGPDESQSVGWVLDRIREIWPEPVKWEIVNENDLHETNLLSLDSSKAKSRLNWSPKLDVSEAVELTVEWYRAYKAGADMTETTRKQIEFYRDKN